MAKRAPAVFFFACHCIFCTAHRKIGSLCHCKMSMLLHWNCNFTLPRKDCVLQCKSCNALSTFGCILEQCKFLHCIVKRSSAKQNSCCGTSQPPTNDRSNFFLTFSAYSQNLCAARQPPEHSGCECTVFVQLVVHPPDLSSSSWGWLRRGTKKF